MHVSAHLVVPDAAAASEWYTTAFGARARSRIPLPGGKVMAVELDVDDADAAWARAIAAGATARHPIADQFWGERHGQLVDPFGHRWNIAHRLREVPHDE